MKSPKLMFTYAAFLLICGLAAFAMANFNWTHAKTALIVGAGTGLAMVICGALAKCLPRNRAAGMIGIHVGLVLPLVFAFLFGWRAYKTFSTGGEAKRYLAIILAIMAIGSVIAFVAIALTRPKPADRAG